MTTVSEGTDPDCNIRMEEAEENELLGETDGEHADAEVTYEEVEETAEDLMTDMKIEDEMDEVRNQEPDSRWTYHIEIYPWNADDMSENFVKLVKLASFARVCMRRRASAKETVETEKEDDKLCDRQRKGCVHLYTEFFYVAKLILRSITWKSMVGKELHIDITHRCLSTGELETAYLEVDTYNLSKMRFREKAKGMAEVLKNYNGIGISDVTCILHFVELGDLKTRSAKATNIPGTISREFLDVVFSRTYAVLDGYNPREYYKSKDQCLKYKLKELKDFNGAIDFDCLARGSCRAFVTAHKVISICGQTVKLEANDPETMVVPPFTHDVGNKRKTNASETNLPSTTTIARGRGMGGAYPRGGGGGGGPFQRGAPSLRPPGPFSMPVVRDGNMAGRERGMARGIVPQQRPTSAPFVRPGPGMPVPMTGRQKMNEKIRRNIMGMNNNGGLFPPQGTAGIRGLPPNSVGDSFKQEIAALQKQLHQSTQALEAKIAMLKQQEEYFGSEAGAYGPELTGYEDCENYGSESDFYGAEHQLYSEREWNDRGYDYGEDFESDYVGDPYQAPSHPLPGLQPSAFGMRGVQRSTGLLGPFGAREGSKGHHAGPTRTGPRGNRRGEGGGGRGGGRGDMGRGGRGGAYW